MKNVAAVILAGGQGERLNPLTKNRAKPAVPFGGEYRIIDFTLSNCINSNIRKLFVLTQYKSISLHRHLTQAWNILPNALGEFLEIIPPQQRVTQDWYTGTADAIYQNLYSLEAENSDYFLVLYGDHIYKMDYSYMLRAHKNKGADVTLCAIELEKEEASHFGVVEVDDDYRVLGFQEKPQKPKVIPHNPDYILASMGIYIFNRDILVECVQEDNCCSNSSHDFGRDVLPSMVNKGYKVYAYNFQGEHKFPRRYWRDVGTIDAYFDANMDLISIEPQLNMYEKNWPILTFHCQSPPAKTVHSEFKRTGMVIESIISNGCIISGANVFRCVLSPDIRINSYAEVSNSIIFNRVNIGRHCRIRRAIIDKDVQIPPYTVIGFDHEQDSKRFTVTKSGITVVSAGDLEITTLNQEQKLIYS
jgi:glucose-1-phosphate adenylyltransferase